MSRSDISSNPESHIPPCFLGISVRVLVAVHFPTTPLPHIFPEGRHHNLPLHRTHLPTLAFSTTVGVWQANIFEIFLFVLTLVTNSFYCSKLFVCVLIYPSQFYKVNMLFQFHKNKCNVLQDS